MATDPDERGIEYNAGPFSDTAFSNCIDPSSREYRGPGDKQFSYPVGQRSYVFNGDADTENTDAPAYTVVVEGASRVDASGTVIPSESTVQVGIPGTLTFTMNLDDCETLQKFHEQVGLKYEVGESGFTEENWDKLLDTYLGGPLGRAMNRAADGYNWVGLYTDPAKLVEYQTRVLEALPELVAQQANGNQYFENFALQLSLPNLPDALSNALVQTQEAIEQNKAQQERNVQVQSELESIRALVEVLGPEGYNVYQAIKDGRIPILPVPQGGNVIVAPPSS